MSGIDAANAHYYCSRDAVEHKQSRWRSALEQAVKEQNTKLLVEVAQP